MKNSRLIYTKNHKNIENNDFIVFLRVINVQDPRSHTGKPFSKPLIMQVNNDNLNYR